MRTLTCWYHMIVGVLTGDPLRAELAQIINKGNGRHLALNFKAFDPSGAPAEERRLKLLDEATARAHRHKLSVDHDDTTIHVTGPMGRLIAFAKSWHDDEVGA